MKRLVAHFALFLVIAALAAVGFVWSGLYDISATDQHLRLSYHAIRKTMDRSVAHRANDIGAAAGRAGAARASNAGPAISTGSSSTASR